MTTGTRDNARPPGGGRRQQRRGGETGRGQPDSEPSSEPPSWEITSAASATRGIPGWAAVLLALAFTGIGVFMDLERIDRLGFIFQSCYFVGCVLAVLWVQRRGLFGPMIQPPLILALAVPGVVLAASGAGTGASLTAKALAVGTPLINGFPTMAAATGCTLLIGVIRMLRQREPKLPNVQPRVQRALPAAPQRSRPEIHGRAPAGGRLGVDQRRPVR